MSIHPAKLGKFIIEAELGKGAMGVVYKARDPFINRIVALKTIRKDLLANEQPETNQADTIITRFKREAQAAGILSHPNIVQVYEYGEDQDTAFIAMEFVPGHSLKEIFDRNEHLDLCDIIRIMLQISRALSYAHRHGIVHRDIKPANIIMMPDGQVKITDFGIAHVESSNLTQTGMMLGTPNYMSPEQFMGQKVDGRSDLFSAGVIFYQFITGENPFNGRTMATVMHKVLSMEPVDPFKLNFQVSAELNLIIKQAIAKRPEDRFQTAEAFCRVLNEVLAAKSSGLNIQSLESMNDISNTQYGEPLSPSPLPEKSDALHESPGFSSRLRWAIVCGVIAALLIGLMLSIDRFMGGKNNAIPNIQDSRTTAPKTSTISAISEVTPEENKSEADKADTTLTPQPPQAINQPETKYRETVKESTSEPVTEKPVPVPLHENSDETASKDLNAIQEIAPENKEPSKESIMSESPQSPQATAVVPHREGLKEKRDNGPVSLPETRSLRDFTKSKSQPAIKESQTQARPQLPSSVRTKAEPTRCKDLYLKMSLGEKLSAEEQRIVNNCQ